MENHLLIGQSGSGKTRIAIRLIREYRAGENGHHVNKNPVLVLNGSAGLPADYKHTDWKSVLTEAKECSQLADDILTPEKGVRETLLVLLNKLCRHNKIAPVCIVLHSLQNTGGVPLLPFTNFVWLTAAKTIGTRKRRAWEETPRTTLPPGLTVFGGDGGRV